MVGVDSESDGLARAKRMNVATTHEGIDGLTSMPEWQEIDVVFDATSAYAHAKHAKICMEAGKAIVDLTPAAIGPFIVPAVNGDSNIDQLNVNMVTCGGQATIPIVHAISRVAPVFYAEIIALARQAQGGE